MSLPALSHGTDLTIKDAKERWMQVLKVSYLRELLERHEGNISAAAKAAGIDRKTYHRLINKYDIKYPRRAGRRCPTEERASHSRCPQWRNSLFLLASSRGISVALSRRHDAQEDPGPARWVRAGRIRDRDGDGDEPPF